MPKIGNLVISGSLTISGSNGNTTVLGSGSKNEYTGDVIIKSGSLTVIGGAPSAQSSSLSSSWTATSGGTQTSGSAGITGSLSVTGSVAVTGSLTVIGGGLSAQSSSLSSSWTATSGGTQTSGSAGITGSLDVTGSVTVNGCVEVITSASCDQVLFTGFEAAFRSSTLSGSVYLTTLWVTDPPYGNIAANVSASAALNSNIVTLYNSTTGEITYVTLVTSAYNAPINYFQFTSPNEVFPNAAGQLAMGINGTAPTGSNIVVTVPGDCFSTVIICDEEVVINGGTTISGSVTVTGSVIVTTPCPDVFGFDVLVKSAVELSPNVWTTQMTFAPQYGNISSSLSSSAAANGGKVRLVTSDLSTDILCTYVSYNAYGVGSAIVQTPVQPPILVPLILADAGYVTFPAPADTLYTNAPGGCGGAGPVIVIDDSTGVILSSDISIKKSLILGPNNEAFSTTTGKIADLEYIGYNGTVLASGSDLVLFLDEGYGDVTPYISRYEGTGLSFFSPDDNIINLIVFDSTFDGTNTCIYPQTKLSFVPYENLTLIAGTSERVLIGADTEVLKDNFNQALVIGSYNSSQHPGTLLAGTGLTSNIDYGTVVGMNNITSSNSLLIVGSGVNAGSPKNAFEVTTSGSVAIPTTQSAAPSWTGKDGEMVFATVTGNHRFYVWMAGAWRSGSLA